MYNGLNKLVLKNVMLIQYYFLEKQQQTDMTFSFKVISIITLILKTITENETHTLKVKKNCISFEI